MIVAQKIALDPNVAQEIYFVRAPGTARFADNRPGAECKGQRQAGEEPSAAPRRCKLNNNKDAQFPWMQEVTKSAPQQAMKNLGTAFKKFNVGSGTAGNPAATKRESKREINAYA